MHFEKVYPVDFSEKVKLKGITVTPKFVGSELKSLHLTDGKDAIDMSSEYGSIILCVPKKPKVRKWELTTNFPGFGEMKRHYGLKSEAESVSKELEKLGIGSLVDEVQVDAEGNQEKTDDGQEATF